MSVTTTQNTVSQSVLQLLADYELHHSDELARNGPGPEPNPRETPIAENPEWWPTEHRRIPDYRPIDRTLDRDQRPGGSFLIESCFIFTMLGGVAMNANLSKIWRNTAGRLNDTLFRYPIGGER